MRRGRGGVLVAAGAVAALLAGLTTTPVAADDDVPAVTPPVVAPSETPAEAPTGWVDPTSPEFLLGLTPSAPVTPPPAEVGAGRPPAPDREEVRRAQADAAPPLRPGFVDDYSRLWRAIESGMDRVTRLKDRLAQARALRESASGDRGLVVRVRNRADIAFADASGQLDTAAKDLYISGSTDVDVVVGVLGSEPDELLNTLDSLIYLDTATDAENVEFLATQQAATDAASAVILSTSLLEQAEVRVGALESALEEVRTRLERDRDELNALIAAAAPQTVVGAGGCPTSVLDGTVPPDVDVNELCRRAVKGASTPQAAFALKWALVRLGAPYACDGVGRLAPWRYDCSSYVSRAYAEGAGLATATSGWAPSTRAMVPWGGGELDPHYARIDPDRIKPGDLVLYDTCPAGEVCPYRHVVMYLGALEPGGPAYMAHTNECGGVAHVAPFWGTSAANFLGVRRVIPASGEQVRAPEGALSRPARSVRSAAGKPAAARAAQAAHS